MKRTFLNLLIEVLIAGVIVYFSIKLFLLYFFSIWLWKRHEDAESIMKNISVQLSLAELKTLLIMKKLNVSKQDCIDIETEFTEKYPEAWENIQKNINYEKMKWMV